MKVVIKSSETPPAKSVTKCVTNVTAATDMCSLPVH